MINPKTALFLDRLTLCQSSKLLMAITTVNLSFISKHCHRACDQIAHCIYTLKHGVVTTKTFTRLQTSSEVLGTKVRLCTTSYWEEKAITHKDLVCNDSLPSFFPHSASWWKQGHYSTNHKTSYRCSCTRVHSGNFSQATEITGGDRSG